MLKRLSPAGLKGTIMSDLPFAVSAEAAAHIEKKVRLTGTMPELAGLVPALGFAFNSRSKDQAGRVVEWCPVGFFDIGWYRPEHVAGPKFREVELSGLKFFATSDALERLAGKQLVLEWVEVGYPTPADKKVQLLRPA